jgi:hypothetical protein
LGENPNLPSRKAAGGRLGVRRPVVVSLALARDLTSGITTGKGAAEEDPEQEPEASERERERFAGIMGMIAEWSGE